MTDEDYIEIDSDLLLLAAEGGDRNRAEVVGRLQEMTHAERQLLRQAITNLDEWLDAATLDLHERRRTR